MKTLIDYAKEKGAVTITKVMGPKGAFISCLNAAGDKFTIPVGGNSQNGVLSAYKVFMTPDGVGIATVNEYRAVESLSLAPVAVEKETI